MVKLSEIMEFKRQRKDDAYHLVMLRVLMTGLHLSNSL